MRNISLCVLAAIGLTACGDRVTEPNRGSPPADAVKFWESGASVAWNAIARTQTTLSHPGIVVSQQFGSRTFAYLSLAQYDAVVAASRNEHGASLTGAVAGASAVVLSHFYPDKTAYFESQIQAEEEGNGLLGDGQRDFAAGEEIGRAIGQAVATSADHDNFTLPFTGTVPVCPACWFSLTGLPPVFPRLGEMRPFFLTSGSQFRPGPPPDIQSSAFQDALAEVRHISDTRTPEQTAIAKFWAAPGGYAAVAQAYANQVATEEIVNFHLDEIRAAHVLALMNMASMDAFIACHDAKYTYWLLRPVEADPAITMAIPLPNHPSYPSNHACVTGSSMEILAHLFPSDAEHLRGLAQQAALSRIFGGIHYRFDAETGLELARKVAGLAIQLDPGGNEPLPIK